MEILKTKLRLGMHFTKHENSSMALWDRDNGQGQGQGQGRGGWGHALYAALSSYNIL